MKYTNAHYKMGLPLQQGGRTGWGLQKTGWPSQGTQRSAEDSLCAETVAELKHFMDQQGTACVLKQN